MPQLKPYLIRAIYQWIIDCELTPYLLVNANDPLATLPMDFADNGKITLNIRPAAVQNTRMENEYIEFDARFHGKPMHVHVPIAAVLAIFAQENNEGMFFDEPDGDTPAQTTTDKKTNLRIIK